MTSVENKKQLPAFLVLTIISLVAAVVLAATNMVTRGPIAEHARQARLKAFGAVLPAADYVEVTIPEGHPYVTGLYEAVDENGNVLGHTVVAATGGYGGPVAVTLGIGMDGMVTGAVVGDTSFAETPDIGDKWKRQPDRWEQFKSIDTANGGSVEAISGATITSGAVLASTNAAINCVNEVRGVEARNVVKQGAPAAPVVEQVALTGGIHEGSAAGYQSDVQVQLTMDDAGVITGLNINALGETNGLGTRASTESSFAEQFVGKSAPFTLGDGIDALAGATVTSTAVVEAVNAACASPVNPDAVPFDLGGGKEEEPAVETSATPAEPAPAGAWVGTAPGFNDYGMGGDVSVTATLNEDGTIATLTVDVTTQTPGIGDKCADEAWLAQFIGKAAPFTAGENGIDVIAGSTMTSNGIINALNNMAEAPAAEEAAPVDGLTATAPGFNDYGMGGDVSVTVTLNEDGTIATLDVDLTTQTPGIGDKCADAAWLSQFIGKAGPFVAGENGIDVISGSTMTSNGIINALNTLFPVEAPVEETPAEEEAPAGLTATAPGFNDYGMGGDVGVTVTLNEDGTIATLDVDLATQTPGIGDKCADAAWLGQFIGKAGPFVAGENGIDVIAGSTMTSNGIINALNTLFPAEAPVEEAPAEEVPAEEEAPAGLTATAPGFNDYGMGGDVSVTVTLNEDGTIATLDVDLATQTPGIGDKCADAAWLGQFVGKAGPFVAGENGIDVISGSTMTSNGIINALNTLFPVEAPVEETPAEEVPAEEEAPAGLTATAPGFNDYGMGGDVGVTVTLNEDGTIATLDVDLTTQTPGIGDKCADAAWLAQFIGKAGPFVAGENGIDVISGSTMTSNGIINALNTLFPAEEAPVEEAPAA